MPKFLTVIESPIITLNVTNVSFWAPFPFSFCRVALMNSILPSTGRYIYCLLPEPGVISQSFSSAVLDMWPAHNDSTETADPILGMVNHSPVKVILEPTSLNLTVVLAYLL